ncbi:2,5-diketo-D-gluconate reductase B [compost metagenome]
MDKVRQIANAKGVEVAHVVLAWYLTVPSIDALIPGAKRPEQIVSNLETLKVQLTPEEIKTIDSIFKA